MKISIIHATNSNTLVSSQSISDKGGCQTPVVNIFSTNFFNNKEVRQIYVNAQNFVRKYLKLKIEKPSKTKNSSEYEILASQ